MVDCDSCITWSYVCKISERMMTLFVYKDNFEKLLIASGDVVLRLTLC